MRRTHLETQGQACPVRPARTLGWITAPDIGGLGIWVWQFSFNNINQQQCVNIDHLEEVIGAIFLNDRDN